MNFEHEQSGLLHHLELYVIDLDMATAFWGWFLDELGYTEHQRWKDGRSWKLGPTYLVLVRVDTKYRNHEFHRCTPGLNHLAFHAESRERVDEMTQRLHERDVTVLYEDDHPYAGGPDHYAVYFEAPTPERLKVELVAQES
jgi:catechol 2,3-dioxygenase-like lactoylglutathione lyase family enzyme